MNIEKIKLLQNKIVVPLHTAIKLLKKNNDDVEASVQEYHNANIEEICTLAECDYETAKKHYEVYNYDKNKAINKINQQLVIITTQENPISRNEIGFMLWAEDKSGKEYKTPKRNDIFIPSDDFDYVINEFESVFPIVNPWDKSVEKHFDRCGTHWFDNETSKIIIDKIKKATTEESKIAKFKNKLIEWLENQLNYADYIVVYGNL